MGYRLLVIEENSIPAEANVRALLAADDNFTCRRVDWAAVKLDNLDGDDAHAVVAVAVPPTPKVTRVMEWLSGHRLMAPTFAVLPVGAGDSLVRMAAEATDDFILCPLRQDELRHRLRRLLSPRQPDAEAVRRRLTDKMSIGQLVGNAPAFLHVVRQVQMIARGDAAVLITGETGTGKELCAQTIHHLSRRRSFPFIAVDCGAMPDQLFENEFFGHARGAFTDAHRDQKGLVTMAEGGTLFLDEIDTLSAAAQGKLLRFLQERAFRPLGGERFLRADVNIIAATNRDLEVCVRAKQFRADLFFRLNVLRLHLPPLRDRPGDVPLLAAHFLDHLRQPGDAQRRTLVLASLRKLTDYDWPGNVRELFNLVQRAVVMSEGSEILLADIVVPDRRPASIDSPRNFRAARADAVAAFERQYVEELLRKHGGNVTQAARDAQKERRAFGRLVKKYAIDRRSLA